MAGFHAQLARRHSLSKESFSAQAERMDGWIVWECEKRAVD